MAGTGKLTAGKQKIEIKKIDDEEDRMITFTKRKSGIYKKASELVTMCGADVGIFIFSSTGNKPFSYGCPSTEYIINRFLHRNVEPPVDDLQLQPIIDAHRRATMDEQVKSLRKDLTRLEQAKEIGRAMRKITRATREGVPRRWEPEWWEKSFGELSLNELKEVMVQIEARHKHLCDYLNHRADLAAPGPAEPTAEPPTLGDPVSGVEARVDTPGVNIQD